MKTMSAVELITFILVIVGAVNWGLVGFFNFDIVSAIFGAQTFVTRTVFALVGLSGLYLIFAAMTPATPKIKPALR